MYLRKSTPDEQTKWDANNVIQELFHFAGPKFGGYSDEKLARALRKTKYAATAKDFFPDGTANIFDPRYISAGWFKEDAYSTYFHGIAAHYCGLFPPNTYRKSP